MPDLFHSHVYESNTSYNGDHTHGYSGTSCTSSGNIKHTHYVEGNTESRNGHFHYYYIETGPEIVVDGGHYHKYRGVTGVTDGHVHFFSGNSSIYAG